MATNPDDIRLDAEQRKLLIGLANKKGKSWSEVLDETLSNYARRSDSVSLVWRKAQEDAFVKMRA